MPTPFSQEWHLKGSAPRLTEPVKVHGCPWLVRQTSFLANTPARQLTDLDQGQRDWPVRRSLWGRPHCGARLKNILLRYWVDMGTRQN